MGTTWVVVADEGLARILEMREGAAELQEVDRMTDAAAHADGADLRRDAHGRRGGADPRMGGTTTTSAGEDELHREAQGFARRVAERLQEARQKQRFDELRIAAAPRFLGLLRKALGDQVAATVVDEQSKDLIQLDVRELTRRFFPAPGATG